jgi:hypothetical protein
MKSRVQSELYFPLWTVDNKWVGLFLIEWIFLKDIPFMQFSNLRIIMDDKQYKSVIYSRDTQEIPSDKGKIMMKLFRDYVTPLSILEHFEYYDMRQERYEITHPATDYLSEEYSFFL